MEYRIMLDKEVSEKKASEITDKTKQEAATSSSGDKTKNTQKNSPDSSADKKSASVKASTTAKTQTITTKNTTAIIAVALACVSIVGSAGHYFWQQQQNSAQLVALSQQNAQAIKQSQTQLKSTLTAEFSRQLTQQQQRASQSHQSAQQTHLENDAQLQQLAVHIAQLEQALSQRKPSDWLVHEAEYLVRVAARTMWLERDTKAAISLLRDADSRLKELDHAKFLPVRALINEDIETLALMPTLQNEEAILTLMALNKQIPLLTLAGVNLTVAIEDTQEDFTLSDDINDWRDNLSKTWKKFIQDFITVRRRTGMVEPLMTPVQQQNLTQNLSLKVQLAQWAASEQKDPIYQQTLLDIQQWLNEYFDMESAINKRFYQKIETLKAKTIYYDYPSDLRSLSLMKRLLNDSKAVAEEKVQTSPNANTSTHEGAQKTTSSEQKAVQGLEIEQANGEQL